MKYLLLPFFLLLSLIVSAQSVTYSAQVGATLSNLFFSNDLPDDSEVNLDDLNEPKYGLHVNLVATLAVGSRVSFAAEPGFVLKRYDEKSENGTKTGLYYAQLPLLAQVEVLRGLTLAAGPELGLLVSARGKSKQTEETFDLTKTLYDQRFHLGLMGGAQYAFTKNVALGFRYSLPLTSVFELQTTNSNGEDPVDVKGHVWHGQLFLRYTM